ncbi:MAG: BlaI/MecI/CopY family transcriptional regulator [Planctomycetaceae bacterium]|nr:BlaI/MecI/CopY family transcriptional regulator [Planctomycetaceae bacterium]
MAPHPEQEFSRRERQIMDAIYAVGSATASEVVEALPDNLANSTVRTFLRILVEKGHLKYKVDGQSYIYRPTRSRPKAAQRALQRVVNTFFDGSIDETVAELLRFRTVNLSEKEITKIQKTIAGARKGKRRS